MSDVLPRLTTALETKYRVTREIGVGGILMGKIAQGGERRPLKVILNWVSTLRNN